MVAAETRGAEAGRKYEFGVFLPIAKGGFIISQATPPVDASFELNKRVSILAEELGLDFVMSMAKWRGYGGPTDHWGASLESVVLMAARGDRVLTSDPGDIARLAAAAGNGAVVIAC